MSDKPLKLLIVNDQENDADLICIALKKAGFQIHSQRVDNGEAMQETLDHSIPDAIICNHTIPGFSPEEALKLLKSRDLDLPFIIVTGHISEQEAIAAMKAGAHDYVLKNNLLRLAPALYRELDEAKLRGKHRKTNESLLNKDRQHQQIINNIAVGILIIDKHERVLDINPSASRIFGVKNGQIIGESVYLLIPAEEHQSFKNYLNSIQDNKNNQLPVKEFMAQHRSGELFPMQISIAHLDDDTSKQPRFICSCLDISQSKLQEEQIRRSQKMDALGKLTGGIAHDFNNMLGIILGYAEMLHPQMADFPNLKQYVERIMSAGQRSASLTRKLLTFSKLEASNTEQININDLLKEEQQLLEKTLTARIQIKQVLNTKLWSVSLDKGDLEDAIINLCINASHAMPNGGTLSFHTENKVLNEQQADTLEVEAGSYVKLSIKDNGTGINRQIQSRIFDPFFTTKAEKGTGLGLSQVFAFVQRSRGAITVDSEPGKGTKFSLYFPQSEMNSTQTVITMKPESNQLSVHSGTVLVVDDEQDITNLTSEMLAMKGYKVFCANSGQQALDFLNKQSVDLVISDVIMPDMDGYELARQIQTHYPNIHIQLTSGYTENISSKHLEPELLKNILYKPVKMANLLARIRPYFTN